MSAPPEWLKPILISESLPESFAETVTKHFSPIASQIADWHQGSPLVIGINGAQGTGKSTLSMILAAELRAEYGKSTAVISIDDIYHTKQKRAELAETIHPLLLTRGVPGTHDVELGINVIKALKDGGDSVAIPAFDKASDDRRPDHEWRVHREPVDIIIFEGWCIGAVPEGEGNLFSPINELEKKEDASALWRNHVNYELEGSYRDLFSFIDKLIMLKAPSMECIYKWRSQQENKLRARLKPSDDKSGLMNEQQLLRFIMHYERLTRWMLLEMPSRADILIKLREDHGIEI
ncbi:MAG: hypothetical protein ACSHX0_08270 [Akkermansiaceae bacterium]